MNKQVVLKNKKINGITLIALVLTIVVLLILAGVSIAVLTGESGILAQAKEAKEQTELATIKEQIQMEIVEKQVENQGIITDIALKTILEKYGTINYEEDGSTIKGITTTKGKYEILLNEMYAGKTIEEEDPKEEGPKEPTFTKVANTPDIDGFDETNTYYVAWDLNNANTEYIPNEKKISENVAPDNWYDYTSGVNHWANVKTTGGENDCYWVWIPRYAYKITYTNANSRASGTIEIKFLKDTSNIPIGETEEITNTTPGHEKWLVHPAFTNSGNGGFGELTGIWVAKYEASSNASNVVENPTVGQLAIDGGSATDIDLKVRVKPNVTSWRNITVGNIFTVCRNLTASGNSLEGTSGIDSHMMKNTEWGAVAYLSRSVYGKNGEVWNNPYYNNTTNFSPITGLCGKGVNDKDLGTTDLNDTCKYNEIGGGNASTTGNVYGVYDMTGGAWEYVAGILSSYKSKSGNYDFTNSDIYPNKYFDWYAGNSSDRNTNYNVNTNKYGDAVYETSNSGSSNSGSWNSSSYFPHSSYTVFVRGGRATFGSDAGMFAFDSNSGVTNTFISFRPVILNSQS